MSAETISRKNKNSHTNTGMKHFTTYSRSHVSSSTTTQCTNCGQMGHMLRNCLSPITSYGIIAVRNAPGTTMPTQKLCSPKGLLTGMDRPNDYEFLLIKRRDSLSFIEFIRGKYTISDTEYLSRLFRSMTKSEQERIRSLPFDQLWRSVWGEASSTHRSDYENSERKFRLFCGESVEKLHKFMDEHPSEWDEPEWGFPKGRRNPHETDIHCAIREFQEETNLNRSQFSLIQNIQPLIETFFGSNSIHYCHKYYLALCDSDTPVGLCLDNPHMAREIGDVRWFTLEQAIQKIRPDNVEKREILLKTGRILKNFFPISMESMRRS